METCQNCNKKYEIVWNVSDTLWTIVTSRNDGGGLLCMECFDELAREKDIILYWECEIDKFPSEKDN